MFQIDANSIAFSNGKRYSFRNLIDESLEFDDAIVIRLGPEPMHHTNENVYSLDFHGKLLWQIPVRPHLIPQSPFVMLARQGSYVEATNWDGYSLTLHPKTGIVITEGYHTWTDHRGRRASRRQWI